MRCLKIGLNFKRIKTIDIFLFTYRKFNLFFSNSAIVESKFSIFGTSFLKLLYSIIHVFFLGGSDFYERIF